MSSCEYNDLFLKCQNTGKYQIFIFDIVNSKLMEPSKRKFVQRKLCELAEEMYQRILIIERNTGKQILVFDEDFCYLKDNKKLTGFGLKVEPFLIGDMFGFTIYRDSLDKSIILELFNELKDKFDIVADFHINSGYYETNDYRLGDKLYFRGYCIDLVANLHKEKNKKVLKKLNKWVNKFKITKDLNKKIYYFYENTW